MLELIAKVEKSFSQAIEEPKISDRSFLSDTNSQSLDTSNLSSHVVDRRAFELERLISFGCGRQRNKKLSGKKVTKKCDVMRKHMTRCFDEILGKHESMVYIGEDVQHGG